MKGTWTGESESIVLGRGNQHHRAKTAAATAEPRLSSVKFTMVIDKQDGSVLRQVPSQEMLAIAKALDQLQGLLLRNRA